MQKEEAEKMIVSLEDLIKQHESAVKEKMAIREKMSDEEAKTLKMTEVIESTKEVITTTKELLRTLKEGRNHGNGKGRG